MSVEEHFQPGEEILYRAETSRISLLPWAVLMGVAILAAILIGTVVESVPGWGTIAALIVAALLGIVLAWKSYVLRTNEYVLTNHRVIQQTGILNKRSVDSRLDKVNNVEHQQSVWGRIFGFGDVMIDTASETGTATFKNISRPLDFKRAIVSATEQYRTAGRYPAPVLASAPAAPSAADRLRDLKRLLDDGLISQPEYEAKRQRLMEEL
ncbi:MAG TPA: PH domain-containing protein [Thermoanaerobaculia bacterium]|nr:PH domain-containing protein [Thermoanaerobaculia bacterium]